VLRRAWIAAHEELSTINSQLSTLHLQLSTLLVRGSEIRSGKTPVETPVETPVKIREKTGEKMRWKQATVGTVCNERGGERLKNGSIGSKQDVAHQTTQGRKRAR
jgi:hypothetical protein